jgi:hypothetical protein
MLLADLEETNKTVIFVLKATAIAHLRILKRQGSSLPIRICNIDEITVACELRFDVVET